MASAAKKITLSASRDIPFNKLVLSQANVRRIKAGVSIEELAEDIARRTLLQSITVRPVLDEGGAGTGMFEIPAGGRRYRALELLVKQKRLARTAPIPCVVRTEGTAEEDSLAENVQRAPLHPLDQFRAFQALREKGQSEEEIAAAFFVSVAVVKQRLRLASVSSRLLNVYAEDGMTLDQLMGFTVSSDHERQEEVWEAIQRSYSKEPYQIRRLLTEEAVRASDKRARYVGEKYVAAGGVVMRDLFQNDDGGWLQDARLLDRLVDEKLERDAEAIRAEGWKWVEVATDFPYGHTYGLRHLQGERQPFSDEEAATREALRLEADELEATYADADEIPEAVDARLSEIETALDAFEQRPVIYAPEDVVRAGAFVSIDGSGKLRIERGYVRPEDEPPLAEPEIVVDEREGAVASSVAESNGAGAFEPSSGDVVQSEPIEEADEGLRPLPDRLLTELTAYRTLALREVLGRSPNVAFLAALHVLCLKLFYHYGSNSCLDIEPKTAAFGSLAPGLGDTQLAASVDARHRGWSEQLPTEPDDLWDALAAFDAETAAGAVRPLRLAHRQCGERSLQSSAQGHRARRSSRRDVSLDIAATGWTPSVDNFFGRVTKARILEAVREAHGEEQARRIEMLKKGEMAAQAEHLLAGSGWLPEPLRTPRRAPHGSKTMTTCASDEAPIEETAAIESETAIDEIAAEEEAEDASADNPDIAAE